MPDHDLNAEAADAALAELNPAPGIALPEAATTAPLDPKPNPPGFDLPKSENRRPLFQFGFGRETRIAVAVALSALTLVSALLIQRARRPKAETGELALNHAEKKTDPTANPVHAAPVMTIPQSKTPKTDQAPEKSAEKAPATAGESQTPDVKRDAEIATSSTNAVPELPVEPKVEVSPKPEPIDTPAPPKDDAEKPPKTAGTNIPLPELPGDSAKRNEPDSKPEDKKQQEVAKQENHDEKDVKVLSQNDPVRKPPNPSGVAIGDKKTDGEALLEKKPDDSNAPGSNPPVENPTKIDELLAEPKKERTNAPNDPPRAPENPAPIAETPRELPALPKTEPAERPAEKDVVALPDAKAESKLVPADAVNPTGGDWVVLPNRRGSEPTSTESPLAVSDDKPAEIDGKPSSRPTSADDAGTVAHVVRRGENFWSISRDYYGTGRFYKALWHANRDKFAKPESLVVGATIRVPLPEALNPAWIIEPSTIRSSSKKPSTSARVREASSRSLENDSSANDARPLPSTALPARRRAWSDIDDGFRLDRPVYRVRPRETLRSIARDFLGDPRRADEIVELNPGRVDDAPRVEVGTLLILPDDARGRR